jgi:hypothetical protein
VRLVNFKSLTIKNFLSVGETPVTIDFQTGVNVITSYWMGPQIAHTLVSFDFSDQKPLVFSIEIRKEKGLTEEEAIKKKEDDIRRRTNRKNSID